MAKPATVTRINPSVEEPKAPTPSENPSSNIERLINCTKFQLLGVEDKGNRRYRITFLADSLNASTEMNYPAEDDGRSQFEDALSRLTDNLIPKCFPDVESIEFVKLTCVLKNNANKEPQQRMQITATTTKGYAGFKVVSDQFTINGLPSEFQAMFQDLENITRFEIENRHPEVEQMSLLDGFGEDTFGLVD